MPNTYHLRGQAVEERFWSKVGERKPGECWVWQGPLDRDGYGKFSVGSRTTRTNRTIMAHRFAYVRWVGAIPPSMVIDHLCRTRNCVNPEHLEFVTNAANLLRGRGIQALNARKTNCKRGHPLSGSNLYLRTRGHLEERHCRKCRNDWMVAKRAIQKAASISV